MPDVVELARQIAVREAVFAGRWKDRSAAGAYQNRACGHRPAAAHRRGGGDRRAQASVRQVSEPKDHYNLIISSRELFRPTNGAV